MQNDLSAKPVRPADLPAQGALAFRLEPDADARASLAAELGLIGLRKLRFAGELRALPGGDALLEGRLGATVVQPCVVTLEPVTTRLDEAVRRIYRAHLPPPVAEEAEIPEDETEEAMPERIDPAAVMAEALALALPLYPRAAGAELGEAAFGPPGAVPLTEEKVRPFAGLSALRERLAGDDDGSAGGAD